MRDLKQRLGRSYARFATNVAVRFPRLWPLVRPLVRKQFDVLAPVWDTMRSPDAFAPVEAALATVDGPVEAALDVGTGTGSAALLIADRFPEARVVGVDIAPEMVERARQKAARPRRTSRSSSATRPRCPTTTRRSTSSPPRT